MNQRRGPVVIEEDGLADLPDPDLADPVPEIDLNQSTQSSMQVMTSTLGRPLNAMTRLFWFALSGLVSIILSVAAWDFVTSLITRNLFLARLSMVLLALIALAVTVLVLREALAFARLRKIDSIQVQVAAARSAGDRDSALAAGRRIGQFYGGREETRWGRAELEQHAGELLDGDAILNLAETSILVPLDAQARTRIEQASRTVAAATALIPLALADVVVALTANVRMIRQIAEIYGGRAGFFGSWRLLRAVATHLVATGAVAVGDDMLQSIAGGSVLAKVSRRFGEGVINGALTARVGLAAIDVCRPMPFVAAQRPGVSAIAASALKGLFTSSK